MRRTILTTRNTDTSGNSFIHSFIHSFIQQCHSARAARARTSDTRDTSHAVHHKPLFSSVCSTRLPPPPASFVLRRCARAVTSGTHGAARASSSVSSCLTRRDVLEFWAFFRWRGRVSSTFASPSFKARGSQRFSHRLCSIVFAQAQPCSYSLGLQLHDHATAIILCRFGPLFSTKVISSD